MPNLLVVESSPRSASVSSALSEKFVKEWSRKNPGAAIVRHNVTREDIPYVDEAWIGAVYTPVQSRTAEQKQLLALSDKFVDELQAADTIVIATPMHNFSISAALKSWIDHVVRAGRTFAYTAEGPKGLLDGSKRVVVIVARGGSYTGGSPAAFLDNQEPYLRTILGFIGLTNVSFVYAENQARGAEEAGLAVKSGTEAALALAS
jgi:FMN-dependent NADH-azoreductase